jgi:Putative DNA-binding domain
VASNPQPATAYALRRHWHHDVHEAWGHRRLCFWLFQFGQLYPKQDVLDELKRIAADNNVTSYASYELLGEWDILARLYIEPFQCRSFIRDVETRLKQYRFRDQHRLEVDEVVRHWIWGKGRRAVGEPARPTGRDLERLWPRNELRIINDFEPTAKRPSALVRKYVTANMLAIARHQSGMKLAIAVQRRGPAPDEFKYMRIRDDLASIIDEAGSWLAERSLYACGRDSDTTFLLMCRFAHEEFVRVRFELLQPIGEIVQLMDARLTTYPIISDDLVCFTDRLPPSVVQPAPTDIKTLLEGPETAEFEIKGSALAPLDDWLKKNSLPEEQESFFVNTICKEIVAFLNSGGGSLLIGALETKRFVKNMALAEFERNDYNIVCGILDPTFRERGWDIWERKVRDLMSKHIHPTLTNEVELRRVEYGDATLCVIAIDEVEPDYYLRPSTGARTFWARVGTSARRFEGPEMERHRKRMRSRVRRQRRRDAT